MFISIFLKKPKKVSLISIPTLMPSELPSPTSTPIIPEYSTADNSTYNPDGNIIDSLVQSKKVV